MAQEFLDQYQDVLHNIEFGLMQTYRAHDDMTDFEAHEAISALIRAYQGEIQNRAVPKLRLTILSQEAYDNVRMVCDFHLGRAALLTKSGNPANVPLTPKRVDEIIACLKRIRRSIEMWNKELGRRGYFEFVKDFVR